MHSWVLDKRFSPCPKAVPHVLSQLWGFKDREAVVQGVANVRGGVGPCDVTLGLGFELGLGLGSLDADSNPCHLASCQIRVSERFAL